MINAAIVDNLKKACKQKNITMKSLLENCDINKNFIYDLEHNKNSPSIEKIMKLSEHLNISIDSLLGREANQSITTGAVTNNSGVIGHINSPTTINNSNTNLTPQHTTLLELYDKLSIIKQAKLLTYAASLQEDYQDE